MAKHKNMDNLVKLAESKGWRVRRTNSGHWVFYSPNGGVPVTLSASQSDWRAEANNRARLRKAGLDLQD